MGQACSSQTLTCIKINKNKTKKNDQNTPQPLPQRKYDPALNNQQKVPMITSTSAEMIKFIGF